MAQRWLKTSGAGAAGTVGPVGPSGSAGTPAPDILSASAVPVYGLLGNFSAFGFAVTINLPTSDPNYSQPPDPNPNPTPNSQTLTLTQDPNLTLTPRP